MTHKQMNFLQALLTESTISKAIKASGISRPTAYKYLKDEEFLRELNRRRAECLNDTCRYLQSKLSTCSEELMKIIEKPETADQVKVNAINSVFANCKALIDYYELDERLKHIEEMLQGRE